MNKFLYLILCASVLMSCSKFSDVKQLTANGALYSKTEWQVSVKTNVANPYNAAEIMVDMVIVTPSAKQLVLPCFYVSGTSDEASVWQARFTPRETGNYSYHFQLTEKAKVVSVSESAYFDVSSSTKKGLLNANNLWTLKYDNGETFRGIGENICWESRDEDDSKYFEKLHEDKRFNYDYMLKKLAANGGNFFRTWMIYWNLPIDWKTPTNNSRYTSTTSAYNESAMQRMDNLVELCDSLGIHMMLALESHVGLMGSGWDNSSYNVANGGFAKTPTDFFALRDARELYKNKLRLMVARYGYSPSIAAWEFFNEVDNAMYTQVQIPDSLVADWHNEMSTYLKSIDPYRHLVTTSVSHRDVQGMNDLNNIDINQRHIYKYTTAIPGLLTDYTQKHNKLYVIGEFGYEWDWSKNFNDFATEFDTDFRRGLWYGLFSPTPILPMTWWWEFFENRGMMEYFINVRIISDMMLADGSGTFSQLNSLTSIKDARVMSLLCGKTTYTYLELPKAAKTIDIQQTNNTIVPSKIKCYNPSTGAWFEPKFKLASNNIVLIDGVEFSNSNEFILVFE